MKISRLEWFMAKVDKTSGGCWEWTGARDRKGYGQFMGEGRKVVKAHRFIYEALIDVIPTGLTIDHLCRNPGCVNPAHLEPVTSKENTLRGNGITAQNARKTYCLRGHELSGDNVRRSGNKRYCRTCHVETNKWHRDRKQGRVTQ